MPGSSSRTRGWRPARTEGTSAGLALLDTARGLIPHTACDLDAERLRRRAIVLGIAASPDAIGDATASVAVARRAGDLRAEAHGVRAAAKVLYWRGDEDSAVVLLRRAEELFRRAHDRSWHGITLADRAQTLLAMGILGDAKAALGAALVEGAASHNQFTVAAAHTGLGAVAIHFKDLATAKLHLATAVTMYDELGDPSSAAIPRKHLAIAALAAGDRATARRQTLAALEFYRATEETPEQFQLQRNLAAIAMRERDWAAAELSLGEARALANRLKMGRWSAGLAYDEGRLALLRGDLTGARKWFLEHLATLNTARHVWRYDARLRLADIFARRGDLALAERELASAGQELDRWRGTLSDRELRLLAFQASPSEDQVSTVELSDRQASVARVLGALAAGGLAGVAFELAERRRARELADGLLQGEALRTAASRPTEGAARRRTEPVTAEEVAARIPERTALLEFVAGAEGAPTTLLVVQRGGVRARVLPSSDSLGGWVGRFAALMGRGEEQATLERALGALLLGPLVQLLDSSVTRLVIVPDGPLHRVPWDALRLPTGAYAVEPYAISVAPSAAVVLALWRRTRERDTLPVRLLALGDPAFAGEGVAGASLSGAGRGGDLPFGVCRHGWAPPPPRLGERGATGGSLRPRRRGSAPPAGQRGVPQARGAPPLSCHPSGHPCAGGRSLPRPHRSGAGARRGGERLSRARRPRRAQARRRLGSAIGLSNGGWGGGGGRRDPGTHGAPSSGRRASRGRHRVADRGPAHGSVRREPLRRAGTGAPTERGAARGETRRHAPRRPDQGVGSVHRSRRPDGDGPAPRAADVLEVGAAGHDSRRHPGLAFVAAGYLILRRRRAGIG